MRNTQERSLNEAITIPVGVAYFILALPTVIANTLVIIAIFKTPSLRIPGYIILCGLALSDLGVGIFGFFFNGLLFLSGLKNVISDPGQANSFITGFFVGVSTLTILAVSAERVIALTLHLRYPSLVTIRRVSLVLVIIWFFMAIMVALPIDDTEVSYMMISYFGADFVILFILNFKIYRMVRRHRAQISIHYPTQANEETMAMLRRRRSSLDVLYIFFLFVLSILPYIVFQGYLQFFVLFKNPSLDVEDVEVLMNADLVVRGIAFINSFLNPILYCYRIKHIRVAIIRVLPALLSRKLSSNCGVKLNINNMKGVAD
ncbi:predicted protein [Nematostella vectensis]|uniref:G-protein coupled receptors family 1 profile domain-containing protein n=1 Tax=Nematostella vectensis TaxID=45351 RepID=A7RS46_NEMVE|nr:predicted protein [Nematostella vectensis]|eukprot:XP_001637805.1 predicted protein [Nematostella vectensis]